MSLPANYKQVAASATPSTSQGTHHHMMAGGPVTFNILKERLRASGSSSAAERNKETPSPFVHSSHGNPAFTPQKATKSNANLDSRAPRPPKAPEKPLMPYMRYSRKVWDTVKAAHPEHKLWEIGKVIGQMWRDLDENEKQIYIDEHELEKSEYEKQMKTYHASPAYLAFLSAKNKAKATAEADSHEPTSRPSKSSQQDRRIDIQPAEDEDDHDDGYSVKHVAYARFLRNHRLINEIFSDMAVPDVRTVVTTGRMQILKRQVQSLTMHQMKLEAELLQMEDKFESKKRKLVESSELFQDELKKHCKPAVDEEKFHKMVERQYELMKAERMRQLEEPNMAIKLQTHRAEEHENPSTTPQPTNTASSATENQTSEQEPMETDATETESVKPVDTSLSGTASNAVNSPIENDSNSNSNPATLNPNKQINDVEKSEIEKPGLSTPTAGGGGAAAAAAVTTSTASSVPAHSSQGKDVGPSPSPVSVGSGNFTQSLVPTTASNVPSTVAATMASHGPSSMAQPTPQPPPPLQAVHHQQPPHLSHSPAQPTASHHNIHQQQQPPSQPPTTMAPSASIATPAQPQSSNVPQQHGQQQPPPPQQQPPTSMAQPSSSGPSALHAGSAQPPNVGHGVSDQQPPVSASPNAPHHPAGSNIPPLHNMPPHMAPHQGMPPHPSMAGHSPYGAFGSPGGGPPRSSYYPSQYGGHPSQPPYHQYSPYPYHQSYGPPPSHYMGQRPPHQGGPPMHYGEHGPPPPQPPPHVMDGGLHGGPGGGGGPGGVGGQYAGPPQQQQLPASGGSVPSPAGNVPGGTGPGGNIPPATSGGSSQPQENSSGGDDSKK